MRRFSILCVLCALLTPAAWSATLPCISGTLASYEALGSSGCAIGADVFTSFANVPGTFGATEIDPALIFIAPSDGSNNPELTFNFTGMATAQQLLETIFTYQLSDSALLTGSISLANSSETGDGAVTDIQNLCAGGTFGPDGVDGCTGNSLVLLTADGFQNSDSTSLGSVTAVAVTDDFTVDGGTIGSASGGQFSDSFTAESIVVTTPEPSSTWPLAVAAFALLFIFKRNTAARNPDHLLS
jgi:hypothetical protein